MAQPAKGRPRPCDIMMLEIVSNDIEVIHMVLALQWGCKGYIRQLSDNIEMVSNDIELVLRLLALQWGCT